MATIILCDGGCGAQSPNPKTGLHDANSWLNVRSGYWRPYQKLEDLDEKLFCKKCEERVLQALKPQSAA